MKKIIFFTIIGLTFFGCSDDKLVNPDFIGTWNWIELSGGIDGRTETPTSTGDSMKLKITRKSIKRYLNGSLQSELKYSINYEEFNDEQIEVIVYENQHNQMIYLDENYLILYDRCADCFQYKYIRE